MSRMTKARRILLMLCFGLIALLVGYALVGDGIGYIISSTTLLVVMMSIMVDNSKLTKNQIGVD